MAYAVYTVTLTDGTILAYVNPQTADNSSSALTLIGQADLGYGVPLNENMVHLLENFANSSPPSNAGGALQGQLWFDTGNNVLKLYDSNSTWNPLATQDWVQQNFSTSQIFATETWVETYVGAQGFITSNQSINLTGDITGSGTTSIATTLGTNGVVAGTYDKVTVDATGRVTFGSSLSQQDVVTALGYTPASVGNGPGTSIYTYGALGSSSGTSLNYLAFQSTNTNTNTLQLSEYRFASGSDWTTAATRIQQNTDSTNQGYVDFNPENHPNGTALGAGNVVQLVCQNTGGDTGVYVNGVLNVVGSANDPVINFENGTINTNNTGFATNTKLGLISFDRSAGTLNLSANADGTNPVFIVNDGTLTTVGINGVNDIFMKSGNSTNALLLDTTGKLTLYANHTEVWSVDGSGNMLVDGSVVNATGNWNSNTASANVNFWANDESGNDLGVLWFDKSTSPYAWRMTAAPVSSSGPTWSFDANGSMTSTTVNVTNLSGYATGMKNAGSNGQDNLSLINGSQTRVRIDGFYDFEANSGQGADTLASGDINFWHGEGNYGDSNPTNPNGYRRRFCMQGDGNSVIFTLNNEALWSAETSGSDVRLKQNINSYSGGLAFVNKLRPVTFQWKEGTQIRDALGDGVNVGFIAQELEEISGHNAVTKHGPKDSRIVHKQALVPHLVSAVQEMATENAFLKVSMAKLEDKLRTLEGMVNSILVK